MVHRHRLQNLSCFHHTITQNNSRIPENQRAGNAVLAKCGIFVMKWLLFMCKAKPEMTHSEPK
jgi:hypothetical protein